MGEPILRVSQTAQQRQLCEQLVSMPEREGGKDSAARKWIHVRQRQERTQRASAGMRPDESCLFSLTAERRRELPRKRIVRRRGCEAGSVGLSGLTVAACECGPFGARVWARENLGESLIRTPGRTDHRIRSPR